MLLEIYTKIHNYLWVKMHKWNSELWSNKELKRSKLFMFCLKLFCYFPFPSEFKKYNRSNDI